jgi:hypothetical protein
MIWSTTAICRLAAALGIAFSACKTGNGQSTVSPAATTTLSATNIGQASSSALIESLSSQASTNTAASSVLSSIVSSASSASSASAASSSDASDTNTATTVSLTETAPAVSTETGSISAVPAPASVTSYGATPSASATASASVAPAVAATVDSTVLVLVRSADNAYSVISGLQGYGIPYEVAYVPKTGFQLPTLNSSATQGNYGGIISLSELAYEYDGGVWSSGISTEQYNSIYAYQTTFGVRFVRIDAYPQPAFGTAPADAGVGCCGADVEQLISLTNSTGFPTANVKTGATMSTKNMFHYPAKITDSATTWEVAKYGPSGIFTTDTTAAVINNFAGRQQMVWFGSWATEWSPTSNFLQHAYIHWMTRGLFLGARKTYLSTQVDDVHLSTTVYSPANKDFRLRPADLTAHVTWMKNINGRMPSGSNYFVELGHNGNGDIIQAVAVENTICNPDDAIWYDYPPDAPQEFQKPLGSGVDNWPATPATYTWSLACAKRDALASWFMTAANRDAFAHVSHTFTHLPQNNLTFSDANKEIVFNQAWLRQVGIANGNKFSPKGLIPPAITGLHNGDAIRAWITNGIVNAVGDNSRPVLLSPYNQHWPLVSNVSNNGYAGLNIIPRWPTTIYWNCDLPACTLKEWQDTASGKGEFPDLLTFERNSASRYLLGLRHDSYMFHQANLRQSDVDSITVGSQSGKLSLIMAWTETVVQEMTRLTNWPIQSKKHDDLAQVFIDRMARDNCNPKLSYTYSNDGKTITAVTVTSTGNKCGTTIPVTFPGNTPTTSGKATSDKVGSEPVIMWATLSGSAVKFTLPTPVAV